jgi:hypothetical protein
VSDEARHQSPVVSGSQVLAAGFAATTAAFVTSRFGVAGTLLGAALTAMIITGGSAILKAYLESVRGNVRKVPHKLRERRNRWKAGRSAEPPETMPGRPDLRDNFAGRMRASLGWFSHLPPLTRRSILVKGLIATVVAFVIGMAAVYAVERGIGNSLSCGLWAKCPEGATPGIHPGGGDGAGAKSSLSLGRAKTITAPGYDARDPAFQQNPSKQQEGPGYQRVAPSDNEPGRGIFGPDRPAEQEDPAQQLERPSSASPAPGEQVPPREVPPREVPPREVPPRGERESAQEVIPSDASPAPSH